MPRSERAARGRVGSEGEGAWVLVVDDEPSVREMLRMVLKSRGYRVLQAADAHEAAAVCRLYRDQLAVALTDMMMDGLDGCETIRTLRSIQPSLEFIAMSALPSEQFRELEALRPAAFLQKPFRSGELFQALELARSRGQTAKLTRDGAIFAATPAALPSSPTGFPPAAK